MILCALYTLFIWFPLYFHRQWLWLFTQESEKKKDNCSNSQKIFKPVVKLSRNRCYSFRLELWHRCYKLPQTILLFIFNLFSCLKKEEIFFFYCLLLHILRQRFSRSNDFAPPPLQWCPLGGHFYKMAEITVLWWYTELFSIESSINLNQKQNTRDGMT